MAYGYDDQCNVDISFVTGRVIVYMFSTFSSKSFAK